MQWTFLPEPDIPPDLLTWSGRRLLARLLAQRGLTTVPAAQAFIDPAYYEPALPGELPDMAAAVETISRAIAAKIPICVWGDFDVDGQTSTALLVSILRRLGTEVVYYVPNRLTEGHGLHPERLTEILQAGVGLILTCDTGIEAHAAVEMVQTAGVQIVITDHHDLGPTLPSAQAVINPKRLPADHPLRELPGVGVAYKLAQGLARYHRRPEAAEDLLDLVALGIVADVATQTGDTRYLLQQGLAALQCSQRLGLTTLISLANLNQETLTEEHIGFWLGPRLNALGRLGDANQGVELLLTGDQGRARILAAQLDALNERRRMLVDRTVIQALSQLEDTPSLADYNAIVLAAAEWHPGIIGIAASRLVEQFNRPVILLAVREQVARGSARSIAGCDIHQAIKSQAPLLTRFGGHPMAAGLSLPLTRLAEFRQGVSAALQDCLAQVTPTLTIDATVSLPDLDLDLLSTIQRLAPFGAGNPAVTLAVRGVTVAEAVPFGRARTHRRLTIADQAGRSAEVIWWNGATEPLPQGEFDLALRLSLDTYRREARLQLTWVAARELEPLVVPLQRRVIDLRREADPLAHLPRSEAVFLTSEAWPGIRRYNPAEIGDEPLPTLVLWQAPPGQDVLQEILALTRPETVYLVARPASFDTLPAFIRQLMGLIKYGLNRYGGRLEIEALALALGHRPATVRLGLQWLISQGRLRVVVPPGRPEAVQQDEVIVVRPDQSLPDPQSDLLEESLLDLLRETSAYRQFFRGAGLKALGLGG